MTKEDCLIKCQALVNWKGCEWERAEDNQDAGTCWAYTIKLVHVVNDKSRFFCNIKGKAYYFTPLI